MRLVTYLDAGTPRLALLADDELIDLGDSDGTPADLLSCLSKGLPMAALAAARAPRGKRRPFAGTRLAPVIPRPGKIVCLGMNYRDHAAEGGHPPPEYPAIFMRAATSLGADGATLAVPHNSCQLDYEAELAVIIGTRGHRIARTAALDHVFGYAVFNDISVRDFQKKSSQWTMGKNFDGTGILGPTLVTADELPPGAAGLAITSRLNGQTMQSSNTREMIFGVAEAIALISDVMTLEPGDIIAMGTPAGVGFAQTPPLWLTPGDEVTIEISGIGTQQIHISSPG